jgi:uncharacterized membrane protein YuzA (DUF378 family)
MKKFLSILSLILIIAGALNWGLWGFFQFDFVAWLCGGNTNWGSRIIYAVIGLAGVWSLRFLTMCSHFCSCCGCANCNKDGKGGSCCKK